MSIADEVCLEVTEHMERFGRHPTHVAIGKEKLGQMMDERFPFGLGDTFWGMKIILAAEENEIRVGWMKDAPDSKRLAPG